MDCLNDIVGITQSENAAIVGGLSADQLAALKISTSGLYLDDLEGGIHFKSIKFVDATKQFYEFTTGARNNAIRRLEDDLIVALNNTHKKAKKNFVGQIGRMSYAQTLATSGNFQGLRLRPTDYSQAVIYLSRFFLVVNTTANFNVYLYKAPYGEETAELIKTWAVTPTANTFFTVDTMTAGKPLKLPLSENGESLEYWLVYDRTEAGGASPKDAKIACTTCGNSKGVGEFLDVHGVGLNSMTDLKNVVADGYAHGFTLDVQIKCETTDLFCSEYDANEAIAVTMAHAVRFKAGELLIEEVLKSPDVNRYTTMDRTYLWGKRNHFKKEYDDRIIYLAASVDVSGTNCYVCKEGTNQPFFSGIYS